MDIVNDKSGITLEQIEQWMVAQIARALKLNPEQIDPNTPLHAFGFDSLHMQSFFAEIEKAFLIKIDEFFILDQETIKEFAAEIQSYIILQKANPHLSLPMNVEIKNTQNERIVSYEQFTDFTQYGPYKELKKLQEALGKSLFFDKQEGVSTNTCIINGDELVNFTAFDYLGLSRHSEVIESAAAMMKQYGTSVSASRIISGEKVIHEELESEIAALMRTEDAIVFNTGYTTNLHTIAHLYGPEDLIVHDELAHNSLILGAKYSEATRISFPHNDWNYVDKFLEEKRHLYKRVLIVLEGIYSMDGDFPDLPSFIAVKTKHGAWLMVDEAHSIGVLGAKGGGIQQHFDVAPHSVDICMGTLSKTFSSCGGYIAGNKELIEYLKFTCPGFVFSVGLAPVMVGAALASIRLLQSEPERVTRLKQLCTFAQHTALEYGFDIGLNKGTPIIPIIIGDSKRALFLSKECFLQKINIKPIIYPAVPENSARLRIIITAAHTESQIEKSMDILNKIMNNSG